MSPRVRKDKESLTISKVHEGDEGKYTCTANSEIDQDSASARLTVLGTLMFQTAVGDHKQNEAEKRAPSC